MWKNTESSAIGIGVPLLSTLHIDGDQCNLLQQILKTININ